MPFNKTGISKEFLTIIKYFASGDKATGQSTLCCPRIQLLCFKAHVLETVLTCRILNQKKKNIILKIKNNSANNFVQTLKRDMGEKKQWKDERDLKHLEKHTEEST